MRRRIRLTGRRQLGRSTVNVKFAELPGKRLLTMTFADLGALKEFPPDAKISLRLQENKRIEVLNFGTVASPKTAEPSYGGFVAPMCQLRITGVGPDRPSLLLASTDGWTLRGDDDDTGEGRKSILLFLPADTAPRSWKLDIRDSDYPIVYVDKRIPDARSWAKNDPIFLGAVLPAIISQLFEDILAQSGGSDIEWVKQWLQWADTLMPGSIPPVNAGSKERRDYIDALLDSFCARHDLAENLLKSFAQAGTDR